jgi:hypothetical protein
MITLVLPHLVQERDLCQEQMSVSGIHGDMCRYPVVQATLVTPRGKCTMKVGVMHKQCEAVTGTLRENASPKGLLHKEGLTVLGG